MRSPALFVVLALCALPARGQEPSFDELFDSDDPLRAVLSYVAEREMASGQVPGAAIAVVQDGELVFAQGFGLADRDGAVPVIADRTLFRIGSISKTFTTLALTQAIDRGELDYDDPVQARIGDLRIDNGFDEPVRVRHLLTHTGGFDQIGTNRQVDGPEARPSLDDFLSGQLRVVRPPGTVACYDTYGITLAGYLLEQLSGRSYANDVRARILEPLGMTNTFVETPTGPEGAAGPRERLARGYGLRDGKHVAQPYEWYVTVPASSIDSTVTDMAKLMIALLGNGAYEGGRLLSAAATKRVRRPQYRDHPAIPGFTHGFWEQDRYGDEHPVVHHGGTMRGYSSEMTLFVDDGIGVYVACNRDGETGPYVNLHVAVVDVVFELLLGEVPMNGLDAPALRVDTERFAGTFADTLFCHTCAAGEGWRANPFEITSVGEGVIAFNGQRWSAIEPLVFQVQRGRDRIAFREDESGGISHAFTPNRSYERLR